VQGGQSIQGPSTAAPGGTVTVEVGTNDPSILVDLGGQNGTQTVPVPSDGKVTFPVPPGVAWITISIGRGLDRKFILIEIITPTP